jgi:putative membrane protein
MWIKSTWNNFYEMDSNKKRHTMKANLSLFILLISVIACGPKKDDSKKVAEDANEQKFDKSAIEDDTEFAVAASDGGLLEVKLGELAQSNAMSEEVKSFGKMMITDHSKGNDELKALAATKNITLPTTLSAKNQDAYNKLAAKTGKEFDTDYTDFMVKDHKEDIDEFKKEADKGKDADLQSWASGKVPVLEHHLEKAKQAQKVADKNK